MATKTKKLVKAGDTTVYIHTRARGIRRYSVTSRNRGVVCRSVLFNELPYYIREAAAKAVHQLN